MLMVALTGNVFPFILIAWGEQFIDSGAAAILMALTPLSVPALAHIFTQDEKLTLRKMIGLLIGFAGVVVLIGPENIMNMGQNLLAQLAGFSSLFLLCGDNHFLIGYYQFAVMSGQEIHPFHIGGHHWV